jgi:hypothetical protein
MLIWYLRRGFWDFFTLAKFVGAKPVDIPIPPAKSRHVTPKPMSEAIPDVSLDRVMVCPPANIPEDESSWHGIVYRVQVWLYTLISPMQRGLPRINPDPQVALKRAFNGPRRKHFHDPELPAEYLGIPDLGSLAVRGPYSCYTKHRADGKWEWDLTMLNNYEHHPGLVKIGSRVVFRENKKNRSLEPDAIECALGKITPFQSEWEQATKIALCAASTHLSLVRHFNWVHLAGGAQLAIATRNGLPTDHPLFRLLWPYIYGTLQSNDMVTRGQMARGGDFETTFSLTYKGMCDLFDDTYRRYEHEVNDPEEDGRSRGLPGAGFETPTQDNLEELFDVMHHFVRDYLGIFFPSYATGSQDVRNDRHTKAWLRQLNACLPNGVGVDPKSFTWDELARMLAGQLFLVTAQHEILGSFMWNYQLWTHRQPARIYTDFQAEPLDVYQRLVNSNLILNVHRRALIHNFDDIALNKAKPALQRFQDALEALQKKMESTPRAVWRVYPRDLKVNINA